MLAAHRDEDGLAQTIKQAKADSTSMEAVHLDLITEQGAEDVMSHVMQAHGCIDILMTAAGFVEFDQFKDTTFLNGKGR
ncbi:SDR family NAD(P)-dependent oxidoreductase [Rhizobium phaseoli]|uniref:SDR family NAD(P)-dependent oxidoreductase n=1 Tax=Rhizobium phaseoli TaxID=396 RepID=UPI0007EB47B6|nr:SDR family NAD(P)-dependent oxidoreductase [Rhizobium phaseoli]